MYTYTIELFPFKIDSFHAASAFKSKLVCCQNRCRLATLAFPQWVCGRPRGIGRGKDHYHGLFTDTEALIVFAFSTTDVPLIAHIRARKTAFRQHLFITSVISSGCSRSCRYSRCIGTILCDEFQVPFRARPHYRRGAARRRPLQKSSGDPRSPHHCDQRSSPS